MDQLKLLFLNCLMEICEMVQKFCRTKEQINYGIRPYADSIKLANRSFDKF